MQISKPRRALFFAREKEFQMRQNEKGSDGRRHPVKANGARRPPSQGDEGFKSEFIRVPNRCQVNDHGGMFPNGLQEGCFPPGGMSVIQYRLIDDQPEGSIPLLALPMESSSDRGGVIFHKPFSRSPDRRETRSKPQERGAVLPFP